MGTRRTPLLILLALVVLLGAATLLLTHRHQTTGALAPATTTAPAAPLYAPSIVTPDSQQVGTTVAAKTASLGVAIPAGSTSFTSGKSGNEETSAFLHGNVTVHLLREPLHVGQTLDSLAAVYQPDAKPLRIGRLNGYLVSGQANGATALLWMTVIGGNIVQVQAAAPHGHEAEARALLLGLAKSIG
jgi:hypothetical protein